jgi:hypothetical protein
MPYMHFHLLTGPIVNEHRLSDRSFSWLIYIFITLELPALFLCITPCTYIIARVYSDSRCFIRLIRSCKLPTHTHLFMWLSSGCLQMCPGLCPPVFLYVSRLVTTRVYMLSYVGVGCQPQSILCGCACDNSIADSARVQRTVITAISNLSRGRTAKAPT